MEQSASIVELAKALAQFQGKIGSIGKDAENPYFKSKYATLENIVSSIKKEMAANKLSFIQLPTNDNSLTTMLMHESGEWVKATMTLHPAKNDPQGQGSAITYARRYALSALLGLVTDEDDDGNAASTPQTPSKTSKTAPQTTEVKKTTQDPFEAAKKKISEATSENDIATLEEKIVSSTKLNDEQKQQLLDALDARAKLIPS